MKIEQHWLDRITAPIAPVWTLRRQRARMVASVMAGHARHYEAASTGRRTQAWYRLNTDANTALGPALAYLRGAARDVVRNNPWAESALTTIVDHVVGWGIEAKPIPKTNAFFAVWKEWAGTTACDADGRNDFAGLQALVWRTVVESGECLVRRRWRRLSDGFALPLQLQVLEPDFLDTSKDIELPGGARIVQGVEFDALGRRAAYWLFRDHPGSGRFTGNGASYRVPASEILHIYRNTRAGQVRAATWFAPVLLRLKDFDEFEDATLMKQKIAACLAVVTSDVDGNGSPLGTADDSADPATDTLSPGAVINAPPGRNIEVVQPPSVTDYDPYSKNCLRGFATGIGCTYEDVTGDYANMPYSAARMSRLRHWARVEGWRWKALIPQFCTPVWSWAIDAAIIAGKLQSDVRPGVRWTAPPPPMIEPDKEGLAVQRLRRVGVRSLSECIREMGYDPEEVFAEMQAENELFDKMGLKFDSDPRNMTQAGQAQGSKSTAEPQPAKDDE
jgi:lambda family phage portal protein